MRIYYKLIVILLVVVGILGLIDLILQITLATYIVSAIEIWGFSLGGIAVIFALDAEEQLRKLKAGEVNEKIGMLYGHAATVCSDAYRSQEARNYYTARIVGDVEAMHGLGKLGKEVRGQVERASDTLLCEMMKKGYYTTEIANELAKIIFDEPT